MNWTYETVARRIDHSLLNPILTTKEIAQGCELAARYQAASVCVKPFGVPLAAKILQGTGVEVGTTVGFPHGGHATAVKVHETITAIEQGATEIDMVINIGWAIQGEWSLIRDEIGAITQACHDRKAVLKVIFENCYLNDDQKRTLCQICGDVNADYVKTSTGYGTSGSTWDDLILMRNASPAHVKLKAAGGIRTLDEALRCVELQCDRIGASKTAEMLDEWRKRLGLA